MLDMFKSKKFIAAAVGILTIVVTSVLAKLGVTIDDTKVAEAIALLATYVLGQGIADHGKEAAIVSAQADGKGPVLAVAQAQAKDAGK